MFYLIFIFCLVFFVFMYGLFELYVYQCFFLFVIVQFNLWEVVQYLVFKFCFLYGQDVYEFLNFFLNEFVDIFEKEVKVVKFDLGFQFFFEKVVNGLINGLVNGNYKVLVVIWVYKIFQVYF